MPWLAFFALVLWLPVVYYLFEKFPTQKAIVFSFVAAWLFLPPTIIGLPGVPDWSKMSATVVSVLICAWLKQSQRFLAVRFRWFDLPILIFCFCPFLSSITSGQGAYDGVSAVLEEVFRWGLPYLIGRAYLADDQGNRLLCLGLAVGGMVYVPFCLFEIRMAPVLKQMVYGFGGNSVDFGFRYGGYRPMVFLSTGLELGWWMCCASLAASQLWASGSVKRMFGYPMSVLTVILLAVTFACKATGALLQMTLGFFLIFFSKRTNTSVLVWVVMALGPLYCSTRPIGLFNGDQLVPLVSSVFGADRAQSIEYRFIQEEVLMRSAMQRPIFGWARAGGFNPPGPDGKTAVTDGLWIIVFGWMGAVGLAALNAMLLLPTALFIHRYRPKTWQDPEVASVTTLAIILPLFMVDNLSNAMLNPVYAIAMGAVSGYIPGKDQLSGAKRGRRDSRSLDRSPRDRLMSRSERTSRADSVHDDAANRFEADAIAADQDDRHDEADELFRRAIQGRQAAIQARKTSARLDQLARSHVEYARSLTRAERVDHAVAERERALAVWRSLREVDPAFPLPGDAYLSNLNDLAWLLVSDEHSDPSRVDRAIALAEEAVQSDPDHASFWNTLGVARYRHQDYYKAIHALSRSVSLSRDGGHGVDFYYLALSNHALGYPKPAADWFDRAEWWAKRHPELAPLLKKAQAEASQFLDRPGVT